MKSFHAPEIRNIALVGHNTVGKTTLADAMAFFTGKINRLGSIADGTTLSDYSTEEIKQQYSIRSSVLSVEYNDTKLNVLDCPGYADFIGETYGAISAADSVVIVVTAIHTQGGTDVGTDNAIEIAQKLKKPIAFFVNKCDNENADFELVADDLKKAYTNSVTIVQFPVGSGDTLSGIVDLLDMKMYVVEGNKRVAKEIPANLLAKVKAQKDKVMEDIAGTDEDLMTKYLDAGELSDEDFEAGFRKAFLEGAICPVYCGSALKGIGVSTLMADVIKTCLPPNAKDEIAEKNGAELMVKVDENAPFCAFVFKDVSEAHVGDLMFFKVISGKLKAGDEVKNGDKTEKIGQIFSVCGKVKTEVDVVYAGDIAAVVKLKYTQINDTLCSKTIDYTIKKIEYPSPLIWEALRTKNKNDDAKIGTALTSIHHEDPTFTHKYDAELQQTIIYGQGVKHIETTLHKLEDRFHIPVEVYEPRVAYRETITAAVEGSYRHKKQSGGKGQFGEVHLKIRPTQRGDGFKFVDAISGGSIPARFIPAVEKGVTETMVTGIISGSKVIDVETELFFGKFHDVDSSEMAFKIASYHCFKDLFKKAKPIILEPINELKVVVPDLYTGDIMGDISAKRGKPEGMESKNGKQIITAHVPQSELYRYANTIRSMTQGKASFETKFSHYEVVPFEVQAQIMKKYEESRGHEADEHDE